MSNKIFCILKKRGCVTEKQLIFPKNKEKPRTLVNFIPFPKLIKGCIMSQGDQLFRIVVDLQKNPRNF